METKGIITNWSLVTDRDNIDGYMAPEQIQIHIRGIMNGKPIQTSSLLKTECKYIYTKNSVYELGEPDENYVNWCKNNNVYVPTKERPILMTDKIIKEVKNES